MTARIILGAAIALLTTVALTSLAIADPGGWAAWRVALASWPMGAFLGAFAVAIWSID